MGGFRVDGIMVERFDLLADELAVLGWYTEMIVSFQEQLVEINSERVKLDVIVDRLPLERGGERHLKAVLLKKLLAKASDGLISLVGIPAEGVQYSVSVSAS